MVRALLVLIGQGCADEMRIDGALLQVMCDVGCVIWDEALQRLMCDVHLHSAIFAHGL